MADGADAITGIVVLGDREETFGTVAAMPTAWRVLDRVDEEHLAAVHAARVVARERAWAAGAGPDLGQELGIDFDATITVAHSEKRERGRDLEAYVRVPPVVGVLGPARVRQR